MSVQDPKPPQEELEKLALDCPTPLANDAPTPDASYETSHEAHLRLLCQKDMLEAENNCLCQKLEQPSGTRRPQARSTHPMKSQDLANHSQ